MKKSIDPQLKIVFQETQAACPRSITKKDLHPNPIAEEQLAILLTEVSNKYGSAIASSFQAEHEVTNPRLSFLFAQLSNAIIEKTFHDGSCHSQAAYSLFELCKKGIFNVSLVSSDTENIDTEHWYLMIPDDFAYNVFAQKIDKICITVNNSKFGDETIFYDTWSGILCNWKNFSPENEKKNKCTKLIKTSLQYLFRPLSLLFENDIVLLENIVECLSDYKRRLESLRQNSNTTPQERYEASPFASIDDATFKEEALCLIDSNQCLDKLFENIDDYFTKFTAQLEQLYQNNPLAKQKNKEYKLSTYTHSFFKEKSFIGKPEWKVYPSDRLNGSYVNHAVRFFNLPEGISPESADDFSAYLKNQGFSSVRRGISNGRSSIVVDLDRSLTEREQSLTIRKAV